MGSAKQTALIRLMIIAIISSLVLSIQVAFAEDSVEPTLELRGVTGAPADNIRNTIDLSRYRCSDEQWQLQRLLKRIKTQASQALQALGYYQSEIELAIKQRKECWALTMKVSAGERIRLSRVQIEVTGDLARLPAYKKMVKTFALKQGAELNQSDYEKTKKKIETLAAQAGFFNGKFTQNRLEIDPINNKASAVLHYESGPRAHFGKVTIEQATYDKDLIDQYIVIKEDTPYDSQILIEQQQLLDSSGYFSAVDVSANHTLLDNNSLPVEIKLEPVKKHRYQFGIGASTNIGPHISFEYENRRLNRLGHDYNIDSRFSELSSEVTLNYGIPQGAAGADHFGLQLGYLREDIDSGEHESYKLAGLQTRLTPNNWLRTAFLEYLSEDFSIERNKQFSRLLMPGLRLKKTISDNPLFPRKGWSLHGGMRFASEDILSSTNLIQLTFGPKLVRPLGKGRLLARLDAGVSLVDNFKALPTSLRFFAGGDDSVRGFDYKSLSPLDSEDEAIGGKNLLVGSVEFEHPVRDQWGVAAFVDTGNAFNDFSDYALSTGAGFGVRWHSPIGPIRLDLARDVKGERSPRLHLSMGHYL